MKLCGYLNTVIMSLIAALGLTAISMNAMAAQGDEGDAAHTDQSSVCIATSDEQALECPEGELFMARLVLSDEDGQNPLITESRLLNTMALYCDTNHLIHHTQAGVLCVLTHERIDRAVQNGDAANGQQEE